MITRVKSAVGSGVLDLQQGFALRDRDEGQTLTEYALILTLIAVVAVLALVFLGGDLTRLLSSSGNAL